MTPRLECIYNREHNVRCSETFLINRLGISAAFGVIPHGSSASDYKYCISRLNLGIFSSSLYVTIM